jgi:hypothetical protein
MSTPKKPTMQSLTAAIAELKSFVEEFDIDDAEDVQLRTDALISALIDAGLLSGKKNVRKVRLDVAIEGLTIKVPGREKLVVKAEMFCDLTNSYGGEPPQSDMEDAKSELEAIAEVLLPLLEKKLQSL